MGSSRIIKNIYARQSQTNTKTDLSFLEKKVNFKKPEKTKDNVVEMISEQINTNKTSSFKEQNDNLRSNSNEDKADLQKRDILKIGASKAEQKLKGKIQPNYLAKKNDRIKTSVEIGERNRLNFSNRQNKNGKNGYNYVSIVNSLSRGNNKKIEQKKNSDENKFKRRFDKTATLFSPMSRFKFCKYSLNLHSKTSSVIDYVNIEKSPESISVQDQVIIWPMDKTTPHKRFRNRVDLYGLNGQNNDDDALNSANDDKEICLVRMAG